MIGMAEAKADAELGERARTLGSLLERFAKQEQVNPDEMRALFGRVNDLADADAMRLLANESSFQGTATHRLQEVLATDLEFGTDQINPYYGPVTMVMMDLENGKVMAFYSNVDARILREHYDSPQKPYSPSKLVAAALNKVLAEAALIKMGMTGGIEKNRDFLNDKCGFGGLHRGATIDTMSGSDGQKLKVGIGVSGAETVAPAKRAIGVKGEPDSPEFYFEGAGLFDEVLARELWVAMYGSICRSAQDIVSQRLTSEVKNPADN